MDAAASGTLKQKRCPSVAFPGVKKSRLEVRTRQAKLPSCKTVRRIVKRKIAGRSTKGWTCHRARRTGGLTSTLVWCVRKGVGITLTDITPEILDSYLRDPAQITYDYGREVQRLWHRLCVLANQDSDSAVVYGMKLAVVEEYESLGRQWVTQGGSVASPQEAARCIGTVSAGTGSLRFMRELGLLGAWGLSQARFPEQRGSVRGRATYSEYHRLYDTRRSEILEIKPDAGVVTFSVFMQQMRAPSVQEVPEPALQEPACQQDGTCSGTVD